ncbi:hypothetical protein [Paenibacillus foliorum]|uniref:hypothetical protein n=1 Tax=Paenibacillus foliorum TaxID=2654974 RepID=UPI00149227A3|nr:hypothetical protein [Paenibacillus foliorum]
MEHSFSEARAIQTHVIAVWVALAVWSGWFRLICEVRGEIPRFIIKFPTDLRTNELALFYDELVQMYRRCRDQLHWLV